MGTALLNFLTDVVWEVPPACGQGTHTGEHLRTWGGLGKIAADTGGNGTVDVLLSIVHGEEQKPRILKSAQDVAGNLGAMHVRKSAVEDGHVRFHLVKQINRIPAAGSLCDDANVSFEIEGGAEADAGEKMVVHD